MKRFRRFLELRSAAKRRVEKEKHDTEWARERAADLKWARTSYALYTRGEMTPEDEAFYTGLARADEQRRANGEY